MPQDARGGLERELAGLRTNISDSAFQKKRSAMISKYHMVRFFGMSNSPSKRVAVREPNNMAIVERKKAMRLAKQARRQLENCEDEDEKARLRKDLHVAEVDEAYAQHHPHAEPYISLYGKSKAGEAGDADDAAEETAATSTLALLRTPRPPIWAAVEEALGKGPAALTKLRERRTEEVARPAKRNQTKDSGSKTKTIETGLDAFKNRPPASAATAKIPKKANGQPLNRRERRKLMHESNPPLKGSDADDDDDEGGFLDI